MRRRLTILTIGLIATGFTALYLWRIEGYWNGSTEAPSKPLEITASLGDTTDLAGLAKTDPVALMEQALVRYRTLYPVGYRCILDKQERVHGKQRPAESIRCDFREEPFSVRMIWTSGADQAAASLYVQGEHGGQMCVRPSATSTKLKLARATLGIVKRAPNSTEAREATRYLITEFGLRKGCERTYLLWKQVQAEGRLKTNYDGTRVIPEVGDRLCHVVTREVFPPEEDGLTHVTLYFDAETGQQVGSILKAGNELLGSYFFRNVVAENGSFGDAFAADRLKDY